MGSGERARSRASFNWSAIMDEAQPTQGKILRGTKGLGTVTPQMIEERAREIAHSDGRAQPNDLDRTRAREELTGATRHQRRTDFGAHRRLTFLLRTSGFEDRPLSPKKPIPQHGVWGTPSPPVTSKIAFSGWIKIRMAGKSHAAAKRDSKWKVRCESAHVVTER